MRNITNLTVQFNALRKGSEELHNFLKEFKPQTANEYFDKDLMTIQLNLMQGLAGIYATRINLVAATKEDIEDAPIMPNEPSVND